MNQTLQDGRPAYTGVSQHVTMTYQSLGHLANTYSFYIHFHFHFYKLYNSQTYQNGKLERTSRDNHLLLYLQLH